MNALRQPQPRSYDAYLAEGAELLARLVDAAHLVRLGDRLILGAEISAELADALGSWGADLADLELEDAA